MFVYVWEFSVNWFTLVVYVDFVRCLFLICDVLWFKGCFGYSLPAKDLVFYVFDLINCYLWLVACVVF